MKNLLLILSLIFILYSNTSNAKTSSDTEAQDCSHDECLNLRAPTNPNNTGRQGSRVKDERLVKATLTPANSTDSRLQKTAK